MLPSSNDVPIDAGGASWAGPLEPSELCLGPRCSSNMRAVERIESAQMRAPWADPILWELLALAALAALGCGLALAQADLLFLAIFAAASAVAIIEAVRRSR